MPVPTRGRLGVVTTFNRKLALFSGDFGHASSLCRPHSLVNEHTRKIWASAEVGGRERPRRADTRHRSLSTSDGRTRFGSSLTPALRPPLSRTYCSQAASASFSCDHCQHQFLFLVFVCPACHRIHPRGGNASVVTTAAPVPKELDSHDDAEALDRALEKSRFPAGFFTQLRLLRSESGAEPAPSLTPHHSYFSLLRCAERFRIDVAWMDAHHRLLQKLVHPDKFVSALGTSDSESAQSLLRQVQFQSSCISQAYRMLLDPLSRAAYMLHLITTQTDRAPVDEDLFETAKDSLLDFDPANSDYQRTMLLSVLTRREELEDLTTADEVAAFRRQLVSETATCIGEIDEKMNARDWAEAKRLTIWLRYLRRIEEDAYRKLETLTP